jgi:hypothetical protein
VEDETLFDLPKAKYYREVNNLKKEIHKMQPTECDNIATEKEIEVFRKNLKKSFIMSFGPTAKPIDENKQSMINVKKSRIEQQKNPKVNNSKSDIMM